MIYFMVFCAFTLLPASSKGGENTAIPYLPGTTAIIPPPTPLLAGTPALYNQIPESSYKPAVDITASTCAVVLGDTTTFLEIGFLPPFAKVPAMIARSRAPTLIAHCLV